MAVNVAKSNDPIPDQPVSTSENSLKILRSSVIQKAIENLKENYSDGFQWHDIRIYVGTMAIAIEQAGIFIRKSGEEKQGLLIDIFSNLIDIPFVPHAAERWLVTLIIKWVTKNVVKIFNKKGWDTKYLK